MTIHQYFILAIAYAILVGALHGFSVIVPTGSRAAKLARHARNAMLAFVPALIEKVKGK